MSTPGIDLATIRLIPNDDGTVGIAGRVGTLLLTNELAYVAAHPDTHGCKDDGCTRCSSCHQPPDREHTEYCRKPCQHGPCSHVYERECTDACSTYPDAVVCTWPGLKPEGQDCGQPDCPKHGGQG